MQTGTLRMSKNKKGDTIYEVEFENAKGKTLKMAIMPANRLFDLQKVVDGDPVQFELKSGIPTGCTVPGKEAVPQAAPAKPKNAFNNVARGGAPNAPAGRMRGAGMGGVCNAVAPYNFVPYKPGAVIPAFTDERRRWSGRIICRLNALTPLLVSGRQEKATQNAPGECHFNEINGQKIIPGTSIKGMLRSLLQILSFSDISPVSRKHLFWRSVDQNEYRKNFPQDKILGGYLRKRGAEYTLVPTRIIPQSPGAPPLPDCECVKTGGFPLRNGGYSKNYYFKKPAPNAQSFPVKDEVVNDFWEQLTPNQESEKRWSKKKRDEKLASTETGLPVFYRLDESGEVAALGFCRYFRLKYEYAPDELAHPDGKPHDADFITELFGMAGKDGSFRGRVAIEAASVTGPLKYPKGIDAVLGGPKPTCLPLYLCQNPASVKTMRNGRINDLDSMASYNDKNARLRGYKLYWHHDVDERYFPGREVLDKKDASNNKVISRLYPLAPGAVAQFVIYVDRLSDTELGGLFEALELPEGCAHKLGMGKSLGFGSVRLEIVEARILDSRKLHSSLSDRLNGAPTQVMPADKRGELRQHFRARVLEAVRKHYTGWKNINNYDDLPPIHALRIMLDYKNRPAPEYVRTMTLKPEGGKPWTKEVNFSINAILPSPEEVAGKSCHH